MASFARLSPSGKHLAYARAGREFAGHAVPLELRLLPWDPAPDDGGAPRAAGAAQTLLSADDTAGDSADDAGDTAWGKGDGWCGWGGFHDEFASLCWLTDGALLLNTLQRGELCALLVSPGQNKAGTTVHKLLPPQEGAAPCSVKLVGARADAADAKVVVQSSSFLSPPQLWACSVPTSADGGAEAPTGWCKLADAAELAAPPALALLRTEMVASLGACAVHRVTLPASEGGAEAFVLLPPPDAGTYAW